jgi:hypothetical protein
MELSSDSEAISVAIYAALTYDIISATNSSPQTTEINAAVRAETLMKWVRIGLAQAALFAALGMLLDKRRWPPLLGSGLAAVLLWVQYVYARNMGLATGGPTTEVLGGFRTGQETPAPSDGRAAAGQVWTP